MRTKARLLLPVAALLMIGLAGCSSEDKDATTAAPPASSQSSEATSEGGAEPEETPLSGDIKTQAEQAALAKYPGTVLKSEVDREKPGMYAVEIQQANGKTVEVYLDKSFTVTGTKDESAETDND